MKFILFVISFYLTISGLAQSSMVELHIIIIDKETNRKLEGSYVEVFQEGKLINSLQMPSDKKSIIFKIPIGYIYQVFIRKEGYISKMTEINTIHPYPDDLDPVISQDMEITLFKLNPRIDFSFLEIEPMAKFIISKNAPVLEMDIKYTNEMKIKIEKLINSKLNYAAVRNSSSDSNTTISVTNQSNLSSEKPKEKLMEESHIPVQNEKVKEKPKRN